MDGNNTEASIEVRHKDSFGSTCIGRSAVRLGDLLMKKPAAADAKWIKLKNDDAVIDAAAGEVKIGIFDPYSENGNAQQSRAVKLAFSSAKVPVPPSGKSAKNGLAKVYEKKYIMERDRNRKHLNTIAKLKEEPQSAIAKQNERATATQEPAQNTRKASPGSSCG